MDPGPSLFFTFLFIFCALLLVVLNAFFVAAEFSLVKVRRSRLEELVSKGSKSAQLVINSLDNMDRYLSATQLGITLVSLALGWIGEISFFNLFMLILPAQDLSHGLMHGLATAASFLMITSLHVVLGELVPKSMAIQRAEKLVLILIRPLQLFYQVSKPFIYAFTYLANSFLKVIGFARLEEAPLTEEELKIMMRDSNEDGVISDSEAQIINRAFSFSDKRAIDIMIPREKVQFISLKQDFSVNKATILSKMHTRFPVCQSDMTDVVGIMNMKDIRFVHEEANAIFEKSMRKVMYVFPEMKQDRLMKLFSEKRLHMAIVKDSKTQTNMGIVTLEDVLEQLVGEIADEHGH